MNIKELSVGNYVYLDNEVWEEYANKFMIVKQISDKDEYDEESIMLTCVEDSEEFSLYLKHIKGVPITEELLIKIGFSDKEYKTGFIGLEIKSDTGMITDFVLTKPKFMGEWQKNYAFELREHRFALIKYMHELQNFIYDLEKKDLTL